MVALPTEAGAGAPGGEPGSAGAQELCAVAAGAELRAPMGGPGTSGSEAAAEAVTDHRTSTFGSTVSLHSTSRK